MVAMDTFFAGLCAKRSREGVKIYKCEKYEGFPVCPHSWVGVTLAGIFGGHLSEEEIAGQLARLRARRAKMSRDKDPVRWRDDSEYRNLYDILATASGEPPDGLKDRVWQRVRDPEPKRPSTFVWAIPAGIAASAAFAFVFASLFFEPGEKPVGRMSDVMGHVAIAPPGSDDFETATNDSTLSPGSMVETGVRSWVRVVSDRHVEVVAEPSTRFRAGTLGEGDSLILDQGTIVVAVKGPKRQRPVIVSAREYKVYVVGTVFSVKSTEAGSVGFSVMEGVIRVAWPGGEQRLRAGQTMLTDRAEALRMDVPQRALKMLSVSREKIAILSPALVIGEGLGRAAGPPDAGGVPVEKTEESDARGTPKEENSHLSQGRLTPAKGLDSDAGARKSEAEMLFEKALASADPREAVALFDRVSKTKGPWAEVASYRAARIADRNKFPDSEKRFKELLKDYPRGKFAAEAGLTLIESYMKARRFARASEEIAKFLSRHPGNERVGDVRFLRGEIFRIRDRDCRSALKDYAWAMGRTRRDEDAMFWRAWCLDEIGEPSAAKVVFEAYLKRYPSGRHAKTVRKSVQQ